MIEIHLREHGTHNQGMGFDVHFDLDDYTSQEDVITELMERTAEKVEELGSEYSYLLDSMEEWLLTDIECEHFNLFEDEYQSIEDLIKLNILLNDNLNECLVLKNEGINIKDILNYNIEYMEVYELPEEDYRFSQNQIIGEWLIYESEFYEVPENLQGYINYEKLGKDSDYNVYQENSLILIYRLF